MKKSGGKGSPLRAGLYTKQPNVNDSSRVPKGGHVDRDATRSEPSKQDATVGPRTA